MKCFPLLLGAAILFSTSFLPLSAALSGYCDMDVALGRRWLLKGDSFTPFDRHLQITVDFPEGESMPEAVATYELTEGGLRGSLARTTATHWQGQADVSNLVTGVFHVFVTVRDTTTECSSDPLTFYVSYPFYHVWTIDWEGQYVPRLPYLRNLGNLADAHGISMSQMFNPRIYVLPGMPESQRAEMTQWVLERKTTKGDGIDLHLHMHFDFVESAGLTPSTSPRCGTRTDGYDVPFANYDYGQSIVLLSFATDLFLARGLGIPPAFRAGGWLADEENLAALSDLGFLDCSGCTFQKISLCDSPWDLDVTSQPYHPCALDQNEWDCAPGDENLALLEIPSNVGYTSGAYAPILNFDMNYSGSPLSSIRVGVLLSHATSVFAEESLAIEGYFAHVDSLLYRDDLGAVKYVLLEDVRTALANSTPCPPDSLGPDSLVTGQSLRDVNPTLDFTVLDPDSLNILKYRVLISRSPQYSDVVLDYESGLCPQGRASFTVGQPESLGHYQCGSQGDSLAPGAYYWKVMAVDSRGAHSEWASANDGNVAFSIVSTCGVDTETGEPAVPCLNFANPSQPGTLMDFGGPLRDSARLRVFSCAGRLVKELVCKRGESSTLWDGRDSRGRLVSSGVYFVEFSSRNQTVVKKLVLVR